MVSTRSLFPALRNNSYFLGPSPGQHGVSMATALYRTVILGDRTFC
jgi:hypothetical protein